MSFFRVLMAGVLLILVVSLQNAGLEWVSVAGVVPNLMLLVTVATALSQGLEVAAPVGFVSGLLLDLAPPADHPLDAWALALILAAVLAARVRDEVANSPLLAMATVAACSFVASSAFALIITISGSHTYRADQLMSVIGIGLLWDVALAPWVLPVLIRGINRLHSPEPIRS